MAAQPRTVATAAVVLTELGELAAAHPGRRRNAVLVMQGTPHCIGGHVLHALGVPLATMDALDAIGAQLDGPTAENLLGEHLDTDARMVLAAAQRAQDHGDTWEQAHAAAVRALHRLEVA
jgi:hypothetical protein